MQRRKFLTAGAATAGLLAVGETGVARESTPGRADGELTRARWLQWLNDEFRIRAAGSLRGSRARLVAVEPGPNHPGLEQFSAVFRGAGAMPRGLCCVSHGDGTSLTLYLHGASSPALRRASFTLWERSHV